jgi:Spy/CpxP family protein refolding chaperone
MKRTIWSAVLAMVVAGAVAIPVIAHPPQGGRGPGRGPAFDGALPILRGLNLTDAQREQIRAIIEAQRTGDTPRRNLMDLERQLQAALLADTPDQQKIEELKTSIATASAAALAARVEMQSRIAQVLTPEQRAQAREALGKAPAGRRGGPRSRVKV